MGHNQKPDTNSAGSSTELKKGSKGFFAAFFAMLEWFNRKFSLWFFNTPVKKNVLVPKDNSKDCTSTLSQGGDSESMSNTGGNIELIEEEDKRVFAGVLELRNATKNKAKCEASDDKLSEESYPRY